jgi:hypothetical protein
MQSIALDESSLNSAAPELNDAIYTVIDAKTLADNKKSIIVRLNQKVSEDAVRAIATKLKSDDPKQYRLTYIAYYLPGMEVGTGAWATAQFDPALDVDIIGLTIDQQKSIQQLPANPSRDMIGSWWDERPLIGNRMTFFRENGKVFMENKFDDGSARIVEISEVAFPNRKRVFTKKPYNGDYYAVNASGDLEWWDEDGHFLTSRRAD